MILVNLLAGPGAGKSTIAAHVFAELKWLGHVCEFVQEFAKDAAWERRMAIFECQPYIFGEQYRALRNVEGKVEVAITDGPLLLHLLYNRGNEPKGFDKMVLAAHHQFENMNYLIRRSKPYNTAGRFSDEAEARTMDGRLEDILQENKIRYRSLPGVRASVPYIVQKIRQRLGGTVE